ncbi:3'-5' exonuclease [Sodalis endosymbiont of Spalangia cameroni]|uniref:3'-5' exonuclease n=1 Tax=Sodalis praecaptivus TaxID=1239307 RepID=UPI0031F9DD27
MNRPMNNVMLDIETLGKKAGCPIVSVAAVMFEPPTGRVGQTFYERIDYQAALKYGEPEEGTLLWWQKQSDEARHEAFGGKARPDVVVRDLRTFIATHCAKPCVPWGNGAVFDIALLQSWFDRVDPQKDDRGNDRYPWSFWDVADLRTLVRLSGIDVRAIPFDGEKHHALADALHQVKIAHAAWQRLFPDKGQSYASVTEYPLAQCQRALTTLGLLPPVSFFSERERHLPGQHHHAVNLRSDTHEKSD